MLFKAHCYTDHHLSVFSTYINSSWLICCRRIIQVRCNKYTRNRTNGAWALVYRRWEKHQSIAESITEWINQIKHHWPQTVLNTRCEYCWWYKRCWLSSVDRLESSGDLVKRRSFSRFLGPASFHQSQYAWMHAIRLMRRKWRSVERSTSVFDSFHNHYTPFHHIHTSY